MRKPALCVLSVGNVPRGGKNSVIVRVLDISVAARIRMRDSDSTCQTRGMIRSMSLRTQLFFLQLFIVLIIVLVAGSVAVRMQQQQIRSAHEGRMIGVAQSVAQLPTIVNAFSDADPSATIQPIAELIAQATNVTYVVVTDDAGIRYSHPLSL